MDKERAWTPVTAGPAAEGRTSATKEAPAIAWMPAALWTRA